MIGVGFTDDADHFGPFRVHEEIAAPEKGLHSKVIELVGASFSDEHLGGGKRFQVVRSDRVHVFLCNLVQDDGAGGMIVEDQNVTVIHVAGFHVEMVIENPGDDFKSLLFGLFIRQAVRDKNAGSVAKNREILLVVGVIAKAVDDLLQGNLDIWLPRGNGWKILGLVWRFFATEEF